MWFHGTLGKSQSWRIQHYGMNFLTVSGVALHSTLWKKNGRSHAEKVVERDLCTKWASSWVEVTPEVLIRSDRQALYFTSLFLLSYSKILKDSQNFISWWFCERTNRIVMLRYNPRVKTLYPLLHETRKSEIWWYFFSGKYFPSGINKHQLRGLLSYILK